MTVLDMYDPLRRSGRTFRALLKAATAASEGQDVVFVAYNMDYASDLHHRFARMFDGYSTPPVRPREVSLGCGRVRFTSARSTRTIESARGAGAVIIRDHYRPPQRGRL